MCVALLMFLVFQQGAHIYKCVCVRSTSRGDWFYRDLRCGKLICTYPSSTPLPSDAAAVAYVRVRGHLCVSLDELNTPARLDPLLVPTGTKCGSGKVRKLWYGHRKDQIQAMNRHKVLETLAALQHEGT